MCEHKTIYVPGIGHLDTAQRMKDMTKSLKQLQHRQSHQIWRHIWKIAFMPIDQFVNKLCPIMSKHDLCMQINLIFQQLN